MIQRTLQFKRLQAPRKTAKAEHGGVVLSFVASTVSVDRYGDVVGIGWKLENYENNPVILWNHRADEAPIGKALSTRVHNNSLMIDIEFDTDERSAEFARKAEKGFLSAVSVGFNPLDAVSRSSLAEDHPFYADKGIYYQSNELLEVSLVSVPANGRATAAKSIESAIVRSHIREVVRGELLALPRFSPADLLTTVKSILEIREEDDRYIVSFAKYDREEEEEFLEEQEEDKEEDLENVEEPNQLVSTQKNSNVFDSLTDKEWNHIWKTIETNTER